MEKAGSLVSKKNFEKGFAVIQYILIFTRVHLFNFELIWNFILVFLLSLIIAGLFPGEKTLIFKFTISISAITISFQSCLITRILQAFIVDFLHLKHYRCLYFCFFYDQRRYWSRILIGLCVVVAETLVVLRRWEVQTSVAKLSAILAISLTIGSIFWCVKKLLTVAFYVVSRLLFYLSRVS